MPVDAQLAMVEAGWRMDSAENLVAMPGDLVTYKASPNNSFMPVHSGSHPVYSAEVGEVLQAAAVNFPNMEPAEIRASLAAIELHTHHFMKPNWARGIPKVVCC